MAAPSSSAADGADPADAAAPRAQTLLGAVKDLWRELPGLVSDRVELLSLELRRAGLALLQIVALVLAAAILGVTAWMLLSVGVAVMLVTGFGLPWWVALLIVLAANLLSAWWAIGRVKALLPLLQLPATRRRLMFSPSTEPPASAAAPQAPFPDARSAPAHAAPP